jgi:phosphatidylserine/phosphatidylglycerophosphate/cardiolipin synthase-like enzyme
MVDELTQTITYKESELHLNYSVSDRIVQMIREASTSIFMMGYKFVPDCDEGRDIFLALHQLGIRCTREKRPVTITVGIDYRTGIARATYRASDVAGLDYLASLQKYYPYLTVNVAKVVHSGRDTLHSKVVTADNLTMIKSGEGSLLNGREGTQREDGILLASHDLAAQTALIIQSNVDSPSAEKIHIRTDVQTSIVPPLLMSTYSSKKAHEKATDEKILCAFHRLSRNLYELSHLDSKIFNPRALDIFATIPPAQIAEKNLYIYTENVGTEEETLKYRTVTPSGDIVEGNFDVHNLSSSLYAAIKCKTQLPSDHSHKRLTKVEVSALMAVVSKNNHHFQYSRYQDLTKISDECKEDIATLQKQGGSNLLRQIYHNNQDALLARQRWIEMTLKMEGELAPRVAKHAKMIESSWKEGKGLYAIHEELRTKNSWRPRKITEKDAVKALIRAAVEHQKAILEETSSLLMEAIHEQDEQELMIIGKDSSLFDEVSKEKASSVSTEETAEETTNNNSTIVSPEQNYRLKIEALKQFLAELPNTRKEIKAMPALRKAELFLVFEYYWNQLTFAFNQLKQAGQYQEKIDHNLLSQIAENGQLSEARKLLTFLNACCDPEGTGYGPYGSEYDDLCKRIQSFNQSIDSNKTVDLLNQSASFMPNTGYSTYKSTLLNQIDGLVSGDTINIAVSNINDPDIINGLAQACNKGVIVRIAIGKYMNNFIENLPGGGGSNSKAIAKLTKLIGDEHKNNLQVRWLVFLENNQKSVGSTKFQEGIHRKYLCIHKQKNNSREEERVAFIGSSPLDVQAQFYSAELDVVIHDKEQVSTANRDLFDREYQSGIDMHFCLAIESFKKAGFPHYAQWQYHRHINQIELDGKEGKTPERISIQKELTDFVVTQESKLKGKYLQHLQKAKTHLSHCEKYPVDQAIQNRTDTLSAGEREKIEEYLTKLYLSLDQYKQGKRWSRKKYQHLLNELKQESSLSGIQRKIIERIQKPSGLFSRFKINSFAFHLAKNGLLDTHEKLSDLSNKNSTEIVQALNSEMRRKKLPYAIFGNNSLLFTHRDHSEGKDSEPKVSSSNRGRYFSLRGSGD